MLGFFRFLFVFELLFGFVQCQFKLVVIRDSTEDNTLHSRYIEAAAQFNQQVIDNQNVQILTYNEVVIQTDDADIATDLTALMCSQINNGTAVFISLSQSPVVIETVESLSVSIPVPIIQIQNSHWKYVSKPTTKKVSSSYVTVISPDAIFANVLPDLMKTLNHTGDIVVLYDEKYTSNEFQNISTFTNMQLNPLFMPMQTDESLIHTQLDFVRYQDIFKIFLLTTVANAQKFLQYAQDYMTNDTYWFIVTYDANPYLCEVCYVNNLLWIRPEMNMSYTQFQDFQDEMVDPTTLNAADVLLPYDKLMLSFYFDLETVTSETMLKLNSTLPSFPSFYCPTDDNSSTTAIPLPQLVQVPFADAIDSTQYTTAFGSYEKDSDGNYFQDITVKIGNIKDDGSSVRFIKTVGKWSATFGLQQIESPMYQDFSTTNHYMIAVAVQPPFIENYIDDSGQSKFRGYCIDMIDRLALELGFTYTLYQVADNKYGMLTNRGDWNGLIRDVVYGDADMALGTLRISSDKENYVDLTIPYYELVGSLIIMLNQPETQSYFAFMAVLTPNVWFCILGAFFVTSFLLWLFDKFSPYGKHEKKKFTYVQCMWYCLTSLIPQGGPNAPKNTSCKVVAATWWLFGFIIISAYTANLAASLTLTRLQSTINSLDDLSAQYAFRYGAVRGSETEAYLKRMMDIEQRFYNIWKLENMTMTMSPNDRASLAIWDYPVSDKYTNMWKFITDYNYAYIPTSTEQALEWVLASNDTNGFAYIGEGSEIRNIVMTDCRFQIIGEEFNKLPYGIAVQQKSPMKDKLSTVIMQLTRSGWLPGLKDTWWTNNPNKVTCTDSDSSQVTSGISVMNIFGVFLVIGGLLIICIVTLVIEFCYYEEKICVQKYHEHHPDKHHHGQQLDDHAHEAVPSFDAAKYSANIYDVQKIEPQKLSYVIKH